MKRLILLLVVLPACDPGYADDYADDVPNPDPVNGTLSATWSVVNDGSAAQCPAGATTASITSWRAGDAQPFIDLWDCGGGAGTVSDLPEGNYTFTVDLTDDTGTQVFASSQAVHLMVRAGGTTDAGFVIDGYNGFWNVSWTLANSAGDATTCAAAVQNGIRVLSTSAGTTDAFDSLWDCTAGEAPAILTADPVAVGDYVVQLQVLDGADAAIGASPEMQTSIDRGNQFVDLGTSIITFY